MIVTCDNWENIFSPTSLHLFPLIQQDQLLWFSIFCSRSHGFSFSFMNLFRNQLLFFLLFPGCHAANANFTINGKIWKILENPFDALIFSGVFAFLLPLFSLSWLRTSPRVFSSKPAGDFFSSEEESGADYKIIRWIATQLIKSDFKPARFISRSNSCEVSIKVVKKTWLIG